ncbi:MAG: Glyoxalase/bleomycin resistance protein/dioxygenase [uncultured bacterium (gcode 4)]|uniref:Glyoxalase/bleomycin resistance protein/dioxygenase n=1 Tax=uncultured bacterium (gcode 4) TaxID=1234023 RepID=K2FDC5_9BACT|nr:MAG: Glyoxalase/bleomycin resistance protein/dioxygenase [uncultured bacterium (gcode 4)]
MKNAIVWFEIPSLDFERAVKFYKSIVEWEFIIDESNWMKMAIFPYDRMEWVWWAIIQTPNIKPTEDWITVYLAAWESIEKYIDNVIKNGWKIILPKMDIWREMGFIAQFIDPEWNRVWIHWMK